MYIEYSNKEKNDKWVKVAQSAGGISQYSCPSYSKGKGKPTQSIADDMSICLFKATLKAMNTIKFQIYDLVQLYVKKIIT